MTQTDMTMTNQSNGQSNGNVGSEAVIVAKDVEKWYDNGFHVLKGVNLTVHRGEVVVVMGPSGSGKSTFIRTYNALEPYQKGSVEIDGILRSSSNLSVAAGRSASILARTSSRLIWGSGCGPSADRSRAPAAV